MAISPSRYGVFHPVSFIFVVMSIKAVFTTLLVMVAAGLQAQDKWSLQRCVEYAWVNNISIKQAALQVKTAELQYKQDKQGLYPTFNVGNNFGVSFGRRENPTTGIFEDQRFFNIGLNAQSSINIFNWFSRKNQIAADQLEVQASQTTVEKQKNDMALTIANAYLTVLLSMEQEKIGAVQLLQSKQQLDNTRKRVNAGVLPELNAAELEAQVARDSAGVVSAKGSTQQALLTLKSFLNLDAAAPFDIETPPVENIPVEPIANLQPEAVYALALQNLPQQQFNAIKYKAAEKLKQAAWGAMRPTVSGFAGLNTNYIYFRTPFYERVVSGNVPTGLFVDNGGTRLDVLQPGFTTTNKVAGYITPKSIFSQFNENFGQNIGLSVNVPLFNGGSLRNNYERSKLQLQNLELTKQQDNQKLKQDIYLAYNAATVALEKFNSSKKTVETAERSYTLAKKRYEIGMLNTLDLITSQNNLTREKLNYTLNQFDYVFKMKVLEFYKGQGLRL